MSLVPPSLRHHAGLGLAVVVAVALVASSTAHAKTPKHCRDVELKGAAGIASQDTVRFKVKDSTNTLLDTSCPMQVRFGESDVQFTQRLPAFWGLTNGTVCVNPGPGPTPAPGPTPRDNKTCSAAGNGYACKHEYRTKAGALPTDPPIQILRICCWRSGDPMNCTQGVNGTCCSGKKIHAADKKLCTEPLPNVGNPCTINANCDTSLGSADGRCGRAPITIQTQVQGNPYDPSDSLLPFTGTNSSQLVVDPIGIIQRPAAATQTCRGNLGKAMQQYASGRSLALFKCAQQDLDGGPCDTAARDAIFAKIDSAFQAVVDTSCVPQGPPRRLGYASCPAPCHNIVIAKCDAGLTGQACATDTDCDTAPGAGDGLCGPGDWGAAKACMECLADTDTNDAFDAGYGMVTGPLAPEDEKCQTAIGKALVDLISDQTKQNAKCQKLVDGGKTPLLFCQGNACTGPPEAAGTTCGTNDDCLVPAKQLCKFADPAGKRADSEAHVRADIETKFCAAANFANLDSCGTDPQTEADCIIDQARDVGRSLADAVFPEGIGHDLP